MRRAALGVLALFLPVAAFAAAPPLRFGVLNAISGIYADIAGPGSVTAARVAVDFGGTVLGRPIKVLVGDHQNKPDTGSVIARRWYDRDGVSPIVDVPTSSVVLAVNEVAGARHKLLIVTTGGTSAPTGQYCAPETFHSVYETYCLPAGTATELVGRGATIWAFLTGDYEFGEALDHDAGTAAERAGRNVITSIRDPQGTTDFSSDLLRLQSAGPQVIGLANAGSDTINSVKQAQKFGLAKRRIQLARSFLSHSDSRALGLAAAHGLRVTQGFYRNLDVGTRTFVRRHEMQSQGQVGVYSAAVTQYLKAVEAARTDDPVVVVGGCMRATPVDDLFAHGARLRADGKLAHELYLPQVKEPAEQTEPWDYLRLIATIPADRANRPLADGSCPLVRQVSSSATTTTAGPGDRKS